MIRKGFKFNPVYHLGIIKAIKIDFSREFEQKAVAYFMDAYGIGRAEAYKVIENYRQNVV